MDDEIEEKYTLEAFMADRPLADRLWDEWVAAHSGPGADPIKTELTDDPHMDWLDCIDWHNLLATYNDMDDTALTDEVVEQRLDHSFGDGLERDYAADGGCVIGKPVTKMSRAELMAELMGHEPPCDHEHSHEVDHGDGQRLCNDCGQHFTCSGYGAKHLERWQMADRFIYLVCDGRNAEFHQQVREMLDTRTVEQLKILDSTHEKK